MTPLPWETTELEPNRSKWTGSTIVMVFADTAWVLSYMKITYYLVWQSQVSIPHTYMYTSTITFMCIRLCVQHSLHHYTKLKDYFFSVYLSLIHTVHTVSSKKENISQIGHENLCILNHIYLQHFIPKRHDLWISIGRCHELTVYCYWVCLTVAA